MNKGFTLIELLIVLMISSLIALVFSVRLFNYELTYIHPESCQLQAMANKTQCTYNDSIYFNKNGNINQAQTVKIDETRCVFQLGMGRYRCE